MSGEIVYPNSQELEQAYRKLSFGLTDFLIGKISAFEFREMEKDFSNWVGPFATRFGGDGIGFRQAMLAIGNSEFIQRQIQHEFEHLAQIRKLAKELEIPLVGSLAIIHLSDSFFRPTVETNTSTLLGVVSDEVMRQVYQRLSEGTAEVSTFDEIALQAIRRSKRGRRRR